MKELNYLMVDMNSLYHQIQFKYAEQFNKFYLLLDSIIHSYYDDNHTQQKEIWFISTINSDQYRKKQFQLLGINEYQIENVFKDNTHYIEFQSKMKKELDKLDIPYRFIQFDGYEIKDVVCSTIRHIKDYCHSNDIKLTIHLLTTSRLLVLTKLLFNNTDHFSLHYLRYCQSKQFTGIENLSNIENFINNHFYLENKNYQLGKENLDLYQYYETIINQWIALAGIDWTKNKIQLIQKYGKKKAANLINKYFSLNHFISCYDDIDDNDKKYLSYDDVNKMIQMAKINHIQNNLDKTMIFDIIKKSK